MIVFSSIKLEQALAASSLPSWEKAKYIIFIIILYSLSGPLYVLTPSFGAKPPIWHSLTSLVSTILVILFTYFGAKKCYQTNKGIDDTDFVGRFAALYMPMTFKLIAIMLLAMVLAALIIYSSAFDKGTRKNSFVYFIDITGPVSTYLFYIYLNRSFRRLGILINETNKNS